MQRQGVRFVMCARHDGGNGSVVMAGYFLLIVFEGSEN